MKFNISLFTHSGTERQINQDRILVQNSIFKDGLHSFADVENCFCFLADGIGGGPSGELASEFVLEEIRNRIDINDDLSTQRLSDILKSINTDLIKLGQNDPAYKGAGTTLVGLIIKNGNFLLINAGDSETWAFRKDMFFKITEDQVLDSFENNSPITSYFGGKKDALNLDFNTTLRTIHLNDTYLVASDGLFKSISQNQVKAILSNTKPLLEKADFMLQKSLQKGSEDNISCILIEVVD
ncbi:MAG: PP2C family protein-serine/threonine phosphatase [bacterium]